MTAPDLRDAAAAGDVVLLPVGAVEQHGSHLPTDVDIRCALSVAEEAASRRQYMIVAPPVWWGLSDAHRGFGGLLTLRPETFLNLLRDLCNSILDDGFGKLVLVVAHGSNRAPAQIVLAEMAQTRGARVMQVNYLPLAAGAFRDVRVSPQGGAFHAGEAETALVLHIAHELVHMNRARAHPLDPMHAQGVSFTTRDLFSPGEATIGWNLKERYPEGVIGDPTVATAETGAAMFEASVERLCELVDEYHELKLG
ncbi:MAG TPA: creatininase family protein [Solirubrobacteraceae bacterium]|nr:creatininase family protein [Solirubrobacteraceae bacterium]